MRMLMRWAIGIVAVLVTVQIMKALPAGYRVEWPSVWGVVIFVPVLAVSNAVIGTFLRLLSLPINCMTFGLFGFVINAIVFWIAGSATGAQIATTATGAQAAGATSIGFVASLFGSIIYTVISTPLSAAVGGD